MLFRRFAFERKAAHNVTLFRIGTVFEKLLNPRIKRFRNLYGISTENGNNGVEKGIEIFCFIGIAGSQNAHKSILVRIMKKEWKSGLVIDKRSRKMKGRLFVIKKGKSALFEMKMAVIGVAFGLKRSIERKFPAKAMAIF